MIRAPYNFVPHSDDVYFPDWAEEISHDIPFSDGISGFLELSIKAVTPIFVRNGHRTWDAEEKNDAYTSFSKTPDNCCFIPATTIKGCIRSIVEIISMGKMSPVVARVDNKEISSYLSRKHCDINKPDMAECLFGYINKNKKSLRGRVQFSHAKCVEECLLTEDDLVNVYMASPKPTYYPIYVRQQGEDGIMAITGNDGLTYPTSYNTYTGSGSKLKGWKRYPVRDKAFYDDSNLNERQLEQTSPFIPMNSGSRFICRIYFHNLKKVELGALLYAIDLGEDCYHSIGFAKPFGYGVVKMKVSLGQLNSVGNSMNCKDVNIEEYKKEFEQLMYTQMNVDIQKTEQLRELLAMSKLQEVNIPLEYMQLGEFKSCKDHNPNNEIYGEYLQYYTDLIKESKLEKEESEKKEIVVEVPVVPKPEVELVEAIFYAPAKGMKKAKLIQGNDLQPKDLEIESQYKNIRLKDGDKIMVEKRMKNNKVEKLKFKRKV